MEIFSKRLKELRIAAGYTQRQMADKLCVKQQSYARYESNAGEPNLSAVAALSKIFDVSCDYLLGLSEF